MKHKFLLPGVLALLLLSNCYKEKKVHKRIFLKVHGYVETLPDEASITLQINCVNKDIHTAKQCLIAKSHQLHEILKKYTISEKDILTTNVNLSKDYEWKDYSSVFKGYNASTSAHVSIKELSVLDSLYTELLVNENLNIYNLSYYHSNMDSLYGVAYQKAMDNANAMAEKILSKLPEKHKEIVKVSNTDISQQNYTYAEDDNITAYEVAKIKENKNVKIHIGNVIAERYVYVEYKIY